jgi:hypothetical protein
MQHGMSTHNKIKVRKIACSTTEVSVRRHKYSLAWQEYPHEIQKLKVLAAGAPITVQIHTSSAGNRTLVITLLKEITSSLLDISCKALCVLCL